MNANAEGLAKALTIEGNLETTEDRLSEEKGKLIRAQRAALMRGDHAEIESLGQKMHKVELRRRAVRA